MSATARARKDGHKALGYDRTRLFQQPHEHLLWRIGKHAKNRRFVLWKGRAMNSPSGAFGRYSIWFGMTQLLITLALFALPRIAPKGWMGSVDRSTLTTMWIILMLGGFALANLRMGVAWRGVVWRNVLWILLFILFAGEDVISVSFWQRVFHAPLAVVLYWIAVLAFGIWSGHWIRQDSAAGTPNEP